jgi:hypothetical protein
MESVLWNHCKSLRYVSAFHSGTLLGIAFVTDRFCIAYSWAEDTWLIRRCVFFSSPPSALGMSYLYFLKHPLDQMT